MESDGREALYHGVATSGKAIRRPMSPHLGIYRFRLSMALSIANRMAGVFSTFGTGLAVLWLGALAQSPAAFARAERITRHPGGRLLLGGWGVATLYHFIAGIRHLIWDGGARFEKRTIDQDGKVSVGITLGISAFVIGGIALGSRIRRGETS